MAASTVSDVASRFESILQCAICLDLYKEPRILVCGHVFCDVCLRQMIGPNGRAVRCPTCQRLCNVAHMTKVFVLKDIVDAQMSISASSPQQQFCELCQHATDLDDLWACVGCDTKMVCSKCIIKNNHGAKCDQNPRNLAEVWLEKQAVVAGWCRAICEPGFTKVIDNISRFSSRNEEMRRRILGIRDLLKGEVATQNGETALIKFRAEVAALQAMASPLVRFSVAESHTLDASSLECEKIMDEVAARIKALEANVSGQMQKFERCFAAIDVLMTTIRRILDEQARESISGPDGVPQAHMNAEAMISDLGIPAPNNDNPVNQPAQLDDSIPLIMLEEQQIPNDQ